MTCLPFRCGVAVAGVLFAVQANGEPVRFNWVRLPGAETCRSGAELAAQVRDALGQEAFAESTALAIEGLVRPDGDRLVLTILSRASDGSLLGERTLDDEKGSCAGLEQAMVLALTLAIDPSGKPARPVAPKVISPQVTAAPCHTCPPAPESSAPWHARIAVGAGASAGLTPGVAPAIKLVAEAWPPTAHWAPTLGLTAIPEQRDGAFGFGLTAFDAGVCGQPWALPLSLRGCVEVSVGWIHATVRGLEPVDPGDHPWIAGSLWARAGHRWGIAELGAQAGMSIPFTRTPFRLDGAQATVFEQDYVAPAGFLFLGLSIP